MLTALSLAFAVLNAQASSPRSLNDFFASVTTQQPQCYGREYSTPHLEKNLKQSVRAIRAKLIKAPEDGTRTIEIQTQLLGEKNFYKIYRSYLVCPGSKAEGMDPNTCIIECDGGSAKISGDGTGKLLLTNQGFVLQGGCGSEEEETVFLKPTSGGDDKFLLSPLPKEFCQF
jgi:hypothetical protein